MHEKLVKQLRNSEHCGGCPYDKDCNEFDSCLMDLLAADAIEETLYSKWTENEFFGKFVDIKNIPNTFEPDFQFDESKIITVTARRKHIKWYFENN